MIRQMIRRGSSGPAVRGLQASLAIQVDGIFGPSTEAAVRSFQARAGLGVDGIVGPMTWQAIDDDATPRPAGEPRLDYRPNARKLDPRAEAILLGIARGAGLDVLTVTSTYRKPEDQVRAMYHNIERYGTDYNFDLYGPSGDEVVSAFKGAKAAGGSEDEIKAAMVARLLAVGPTKVSRHAGIPGLAVVDLSPPSDRTGIESALRQAQAAGIVSQWIGPPSDPAYHVEIPILGLDPTAPVS